MWSWPKIDKSQSYSYHKDTIRQQSSNDSKNKCVYCGLHESQFGGERNFQVDHFRPKSFPEFQHLDNDYNNLYWACCVCNNLKRDDWPSNDISPEDICYLDPMQYDYNTMNLVHSNGLVESTTVAMKYINERLGFNRSHLSYTRRESNVLNKARSVLSKVHDISSTIKTNSELSTLVSEQLNSLVILMAEINDKCITLHESKPYESKDVKRPTY